MSKSFNFKHLITYVVIILILPHSSYCFFDAIIVVVASGFNYLRCLTECCDTPWYKPNITGLTAVLNENLHGQHLVTRSVVNTIKGHLNDPNPPKALVLSLHGWTGGGKNYVTSYIANHLFLKGERSQYVHKFVAPLHFPHESHVREYKSQLHNWISGNVSNCAQSLFIFDEMDKLPVGLIDTIKPFLDHYEHLDNIDYRKSIFIFLSNTGGNSITSLAMEHWKAGKKRQDIGQKEMEDVIIQGAFNEHGGLWHSDLLQKNLVSAFVPFLPLEQSHVKKCIHDDLRRKNHTVSNSIVEKVMQEMTFFPNDIKLYSTTGCKRVAEKVNFVIEGEQDGW